jgi:hypothetical protein
MAQYGSEWWRNLRHKPARTRARLPVSTSCGPKSARSSRISTRSSVRKHVAGRRRIGKPFATTRGLPARQLPMRAVSSSRSAVRERLTSRLAPTATPALPSHKGSLAQPRQRRILVREGAWDGKAWSGKASHCPASLSAFSVPKGLSFATRQARRNLFFDEHARAGSLEGLRATKRNHRVMGASRPRHFDP